MEKDKLPHEIEHCLGEISVDDFLKDYWQKKPLLIRNAFSDMRSLISADELAGLACEQHINSRIVLEKSGDRNWQVEHGPFDESKFSELPETHWSLLVSDVEKHVPETKSLLKAFRFIPDWRVDDLMVSYAPTGGSVGAHTDAYDVFLIQLSGQRLWKISEHYPEEILNDTDLCILKEFVAEQEWLLSSGDMLYLPPNVAHHGIAQNYKDKDGNEEHCMTASVGFRAPSISTMTSDYVHYLNENNQLTKRYKDKSPKQPEHHAEITDETVTNFIEYIEQGLSIEREQVKRWLGQYCSDNKAFEDFSNEHRDVSSDEFTVIASQSTLSQSPYSHFLFSISTQALLFVDGVCYETSKAFAEHICDDEAINFPQLQKIMSPEDEAILLILYNNGAIITS